MCLKEYVKGAGEGGFISTTPLTVTRRDRFRRRHRREHTGAVRPGIGTRGKLDESQMPSDIVSKEANGRGEREWNKAYGRQVSGRSSE